MPVNLRNYFVCYVTSFCKILNYFVHIIKRVNFLDYEVFAKQSFTVLTKIGKNKQTNREALLQVNLSYDTEIFNNLFSFGLCLFNSKSSNIANCKFQNCILFVLNKKIWNLLFLWRESHGIGESLLMDHLVHIIGLRSTWKSNWCYMNAM